MSVRSSRATSSAMPSTWPATIWPPSSSPIFSARSRLSRVPCCPAPGRGEPQRLGGGIDREPGAVASSPVSTTVRQTPEQAIEAPIAIDGARIGAGDLEPAQTLGPRLDREHLADVGDDPVNISTLRSNVSSVSSPIVSRADRLRASAICVSAVSGMPSSASMPSAPIALGERNSAASSTRSACDERRRDRRPALDHQPRDAALGQRLQHLHADRAGRPSPSTRNTSTPLAFKMSSAIGGRARRARTPRSASSRAVPTSDVDSGRRSCASSTTRTGERSAHARQPAGQLRIVGQHGADADQDRVGLGAHQMHARRAPPRR